MRHPSTVALCALSAVAVTVAGCGVDPATVPVPGTGVTGDTYTVHVEFTDALNLPMRAKVFADGAQIGTVMDVSVVDPSPGPEPEAATPLSISSCSSRSGSLRRPERNCDNRPSSETSTLR